MVGRRRRLRPQEDPYLRPRLPLHRRQREAFRQTLRRFLREWVVALGPRRRSSLLLGRRHHRLEVRRLTRRSREFRRC